MNPSEKLTKYLQRYGVPMTRPVRTASTEGVERVVVIPALAERGFLFGTLSSIAKNPPEELAKSLVLCVINNHPPPLASLDQIRDNQNTLRLLEGFLTGDGSDPEMRDDLREIMERGLRIAWIDASSPGCEIPERDGGVGTARKIGMDAALTVLDGRGPGGGVICCLDADTWVMENYLAAVADHFSTIGEPAAVACYAHRRPDDPQLFAAICGYEIFLRAYVMGLSFAGSPYAFHSIGSTMACTAQAYVAVRGMNRRAAAEDFHFLDKLAKIGHVGVIQTTTVFPSARISNRVPFGTGRRMSMSMAEQTDELRLYDSRIFLILRDWLSLVEANPDSDSESIAAAAQEIHPALREYLDLSRFAEDWKRIRHNASDHLHFKKQFHTWFDGLKTLRLVHHLSRSEFPPVAMIEGLKGLLELIGRSVPAVAYLPESIQNVDVQFRILEELRFLFPKS